LNGKKKEKRREEKRREERDFLDGSLSLSIGRRFLRI